MKTEHAFGPIIERLKDLTRQLGHDRDMCEVLILEGIDKVFSVYLEDSEFGAIVVNDALDVGMTEFMHTKKPVLIIEKTWWTFIKNGAGWMRLLRIRSAMRQEAWIAEQGK